MRCSVNSGSSHEETRVPARNDDGIAYDHDALLTDLQRYWDARLAKKTHETSAKGIAGIIAHLRYGVINTALCNRKSAIQSIKNATNYVGLMSSLEGAWREHSGHIMGANSNKPTGKLGEIIALHWNRLRRATPDQRNAINQKLSGNDAEMIPMQLG